MDYTLPTVMVIALIVLLPLALALADTSWAKGRPFALALLRTGEVVAAALLLLALIETTRSGASSSSVEDGAVLLVFAIGVLAGLAGAEELLRREDREPSEPDPEESSDGDHRTTGETSGSTQPWATDGGLHDGGSR